MLKIANTFFCAYYLSGTTPRTLPILILLNSHNFMSEVDTIITSAFQRKEIKYREVK